FFPYLLQQRIVEAKNIFECAVRHPPLALEPPHHRREHRLETTLGFCPALRVWLGGCWSTHPDQDAAVLIHGQTLTLDEFVLHIVHIRIIELELPLESAIGETPPALEHGDRLVQKLLKGHRQPSVCATVRRGWYGDGRCCQGIGVPQMTGKGKQEVCKTMAQGYGTSPLTAHARGLRRSNTSGILARHRSVTSMKQS